MDNYLKFYDLETYLLKEVGPNFCQNGILEPVDLYMVFIWKAERAKNKERDRLKKKAGGSFAEAVAQIARSLHFEKGQKEKLRILMVKWGMFLPMASSVLMFLYPDEFTVYDRRACAELKMKYRGQAPFSDTLWNEYQQFQNAVVSETPPGCLRDKDRYLWAKFGRDKALKDCRG